MLMIHPYQPTPSLKLAIFTPETQGLVGSDEFPFWVAAFFQGELTGC